MPALVIDHESKDSTARIALAHGANVVERRFDDFLSARRFALARVQTPWTLMIDADEALDERLRDSLQAAAGDVDGYVLLRTTFYCGKPMRVWRREPLLRLFRTDRAHLRAAPVAGGGAQLHERWTCVGPTATLNGTLLHHCYPTHEAYRAKFERYTTIESAGVRASALAFFMHLLLVPLRFVWLAVRRGAVFDGIRGLRVAWWSAWYPAAVQQKALARDAAG